MTLADAHGALYTLLTATPVTGVDLVYNYEDPTLYGQGKTVLTVSFGSPAMDAESWYLTARIYASWANSFATAHAALLAAIQTVDDLLTATYPRLTWETDANETIGCFVATAAVQVGRDDF